MNLVVIASSSSHLDLAKQTKFLIESQIDIKASAVILECREPVVELVKIMVDGDYPLRSGDNVCAVVATIDEDAMPEETISQLEYLGDKLDQTPMVLAFPTRINIFSSTWPVLTLPISEKSLVRLTLLDVGDGDTLVKTMQILLAGGDVSEHFAQPDGFSDIQSVKDVLLLKERYQSGSISRLTGRRKEAEQLDKMAVPSVKKASSPVKAAPPQMEASADYAAPLPKSKSSSRIIGPRFFPVLIILVLIVVISGALYFF